jgi:hypothetical protein
VIARDGSADGIAPGVGAVGVDVFVLREMDGLDEGIGEVRESAGGAGFDVAFGNSDEEASDGCAEIASGEIVGREEVRDIATKKFQCARSGFSACVEMAEVRVFVRAGRTATASVGEGEGTEQCAVLGARRHGCLQKRYWDLRGKDAEISKGSIAQLRYRVK